MYLPVEGVYYELVCNRIGGDANPVAHAQSAGSSRSPRTPSTATSSHSPRASKASRSRSTHTRSWPTRADLNRDFARFKARLRAPRQAPRQRTDEVRRLREAAVALRREARARRRVRARGRGGRARRAPPRRRRRIGVLPRGKPRASYTRVRDGSVEFSWFFLWLGVALLGLGLLLLRTWWRERRFPGAALTLSAGLLLDRVAPSSSSSSSAWASAAAGRSTRRRSSRSRSSPPCLPPPSGASSRPGAGGRACAGAPLGRAASRSSSSSAPSRGLSSRAGPVEQVGGDILETAAPAVGADAAVLLLYDADRRTLDAAAASGIPGELWRAFELDVSDDFNQFFLAPRASRSS